MLRTLRLGVLTPSSNTALEPLTSALAAGMPGCTAHFSRFKVTEIRIVTPDNIGWAIAAQSRSSMTLQTCLGARSERRLLVRLVEFH